jgi:hypothetical protein
VVRSTPRPGAFQLYFAGASAPTFFLAYLAAHDLFWPVSDAEIAAGPPEDTLGLGLGVYLAFVAIPVVIWLLLFLRALTRVSSPLHRGLAASQALVVLASLVAIVLAYRTLEHRVFPGPRAGPLAPSANSTVVHENRAA